MSRIKSVTPESATEIQKDLLANIKRQYGGVVPGVYRIFLVDLALGKPIGDIYQYLHLRKSSPLTKLQREMLAVVVNGIVGGAP
ncbi:MAG: hypothetical protein HY644_03450 [Acidobacteria bacterium]|nr:hypothetical protein [Acidobacteriota bacterium]